MATDFDDTRFGDDEIWMAQAIALGNEVRPITSPNPWVGAVVVPAGEEPVAEGATQPPGGPHAEVVALGLAGDSARGSTLYVTLEPCAHHGRTPPCAEAVIAAEVRRVVIGVLDPDPHVSGRGVELLRQAGLDVRVGVLSGEVESSLAPYLKHRRTGLPWVVLKLASTLDGRIAAPDGSSRWITGPQARADVHQLRAESDAILVGAGTVRSDDPSLTVRDVATTPGRDPLRVVLGKIPPGARVEPALVHSGDPEDLLYDLGERDVIQLLVEGGARVAWLFHNHRLIDQYVVYFAPALMGGDDGVPLLRGPGAATMDAIWRGRISSVRQIGPDVRIDVLAGEEGRAVP
ncbi:MAG TPA: bifunctional diaminohydroxyphosphoribosylaminopyrimidine deaminase/5-amino-6-(5-phosphoribosylamino)uracil reductase RibD [Acidimicrobiales bacterium]